MPSVATTDEMIDLVDAELSKMLTFNKGDLVVVVAGSPPNTSGSTNLIRVHRIGEADFD